MTAAPQFSGPREPAVDKESSVSRRRTFLSQSLQERIACATWTLSSALFFRPTPASFNRIRIILLRCFGASIDSSVFIHQTVRVDYPWNLVIGPDCVVEHRVILNCMGRIDIGARCRISQYAHLCAGTHNYTASAMEILRKPISIGADVWIAADAFVGPGVTIGDGSLLAARSSAFGSLPAGYVCIGEPAVPRKRRFLDQQVS